MKKIGTKEMGKHCNKYTHSLNNHLLESSVVISSALNPQVLCEVLGLKLKVSNIPSSQGKDNKPVDKIGLAICDSIRYL